MGRPAMNSALLCEIVAFVDARNVPIHADFLGIS
jgi:hypothetical protein